MMDLFQRYIYNNRLNMSEFSEAILEKKLTELRDSQKEIQLLSQFCCDNRQHCKVIVRAWYKNLKVTTRKLTAMYLANDVVQNSKKKGPEFAKEFGHVLKKVFEHLSSLRLDDKTIVSLARLISIWVERQIFDRKILHEISKMWDHKRKTGKALAPSDHISPKRRSREVSDGSGSGPEERRKSRDQPDIDVDDMLDASMEAAAAADQRPGPEVVEILTLSPRQGGSPGSGDPPEPEELIQALQDLENSASSDAIVREKIAKLPPEVSEVTKLEGIKSAAEAQVLQGQVEEANTLLDDYNRRLQEELRYRKKVGKMIGEFLSAQKDLLAQAEERLETYLDKLEKIHQVKEELKSHIASLPDIPVLPTSTGLAPLPSAGDLFTH